MDWSNRFTYEGFVVSYSSFQSIQELLEKCLQLEAHETSSFCLGKIKRSM